MKLDPKIKTYNPTQNVIDIKLKMTTESDKKFIIKPKNIIIVFKEQICRTQKYLIRSTNINKWDLILYEIKPDKSIIRLKHV